MCRACVSFVSQYRQYTYKRGIMPVEEYDHVFWFCAAVITFPLRSIQGFVQKADAENVLRNCTPGTFLIRFSEGEPGGVSIAWVTEGDLTSSDAQVLSLAPWNKHDLGMRGFADRCVWFDLYLCVWPHRNLIAFFL